MDQIEEEMEEARDDEEDLIDKEKTAHEGELKFRTRMCDHLKDQLENLLSMNPKK
jgi:hypothetical protein